MQPVSASDLITEALEELRAMTAGDALNATDAAKGLSCLNRQIDTYNIGKGNLFAERLDTYTLTIGKQKYTVGTDPAGVLVADLTGPRPVRLSRANLLLSSASNTVRRKINLFTDEQWWSKAAQNIAGLPLDLYNDRGNPLSTWWFYMVPDKAYVIETYSWQQGAAIPPTIGVGTVTTIGTAVTWVSGPQFTSAQQGAGILINGVTYVVQTYTNATTLALTASAGTQALAVPYVTGGIASLIVVPQGYYEHHLYSLVMRLAGPFGVTPSESSIELWRDAKEAVQALNALSPRIRSDGDLPSAGEGLYNWLSGESEDY